MARSKFRDIRNGEKRRAGEGARKKYARKLLQVLEGDMREKGNTIDLIVTVNKADKDYLQRHIIEPNAKAGHYINNAGVLTFKSGLKFAKDIIEAWTYGNNSLAKSYPGTIDSVMSIEPASEVIAGPIRKSKKSLEQGWNLDFIGVPEAQRHGRGEGIKIAILDTGADYNHEEIKARYGKEKGVNFVNPGDDVMDRHGHGTHVSGTAAGKNVGIANKAQLYAVKILNDKGSGSDADIIAGIDWCITKGVDVINMSLGGPVYSYAFQEVCYAAAEHGLLVVAAAGNSGDRGEGESYPAAYDNVISVASIDENGERSYFSNKSITLDIAAPGESIYSSVPGGYASFDGTSMAAPHITGGVALLKSFMKNSHLEAIVKRTSTEPHGGRDRNDYGAGIVDLASAVRGNSRMKNTLKKIYRVLF